MSKNGSRVVYDPIGSHAATHIDDTPQLKSLLVEAISKMSLEDDEIKTHVDMGRTIGVCNVVKVNEDDILMYGVRKNRVDDGLVPFIKNRKGDDCSTVAMHLVRQANSDYFLSSAWIGVFDEENDEPFPQSATATSNSISFWNKHAFVYGSQEIIAGTETEHYPW
jgi:hypothetical protein